MTWGHASSSDLSHWEHEPIAINPTKGGTDASGCWSGTTFFFNDWSTTLIYTGVRQDICCALIMCSFAYTALLATFAYAHGCTADASRTRLLLFL